MYNRPLLYSASSIGGFVAATVWTVFKEWADALQQQCRMPDRMPGSYRRLLMGEVKLRLQPFVQL